MQHIAEQFEITAHPQNAGVARDRVKHSAQTAGFADLALSDIEIAVGEAVTNAILYGSPTATSHIIISASFEEEDSAFHVEVHDQGRGFDPGLLRQEVDTDALGGRGIRLMRALMDQVLLFYDGHGMVVRLTKILPR